MGLQVVLYTLLYEYTPAVVRCCMELWRWDVEYWGKAENLHMIDWYLDLNGRNATDDWFKSMILNEGIKYVVAIDTEYIYIYIYIIDGKSPFG